MSLFRDCLNVDGAEVLPSKRAFCWHRMHCEMTVNKVPPVVTIVGDIMMLRAYASLMIVVALMSKEKT